MFVSSGWSWPGPKIAGKNSGCSLPSMTLASVTAERAAAAVAGRARVGAGRVRADAKASGLEMQDRAAAGRHRVDAHHRRAHAHAGDLRVEGALVLAVIVRNVGRGAAHVEADHLVEAGEPCRSDHADHATGRTGQQRVLALEHVGSRQPPRRHHEHQARAFSGGRSVPVLPPPGST